MTISNKRFHEVEMMLRTIDNEFGADTTSRDFPEWRKLLGLPIVPPVVLSQEVFDKYFQIVHHTSSWRPLTPAIKRITP